MEIVVNRQKYTSRLHELGRQAGPPRRHKNKNPKIPNEAPTLSIYRISRSWGHRGPACCEEPRAWYLDSRNPNISRSTGYHSVQLALLSLKDGEFYPFIQRNANCPSECKLKPRVLGKAPTKLTLSVMNLSKINNWFKSQLCQRLPSSYLLKYKPTERNRCIDNASL